ncbi:MAG: hypothetical protein OIF40_01190 [Mangrovicoccus sp.]|nr:hypothetical protein [Mangrovicoccus sp.]
MDAPQDHLRCLVTSFGGYADHSSSAQGRDSCPTGQQDSDLATGAPYNSENEGPILILNGGTDAAPNDDYNGSTFCFSFAETVDFTATRIIDLSAENIKNNLQFDFTLANGKTTSFAGNGVLSIATLLNPNMTENNTVWDLAFEMSDLRKLDLTLQNISGAIGAVSYSPAVVPVPLTLPLLGAGLGMLRRRARLL